MLIIVVIKTGILFKTQKQNMLNAATKYLNIDAQKKHYTIFLCRLLSLMTIVDQCPKIFNVRFTN